MHLPLPPLARHGMGDTRPLRKQGTRGERQRLTTSRHSSDPTPLRQELLPHSPVTGTIRFTLPSRLEADSRAAAWNLHLFRRVSGIEGTRIIWKRTPSVHQNMVRHGRDVK